MIERDDAIWVWSLFGIMVVGVVLITAVSSYYIVNRGIEAKCGPQEHTHRVELAPY